MTLQLELGKKYLNRRGEVVEIMKDWGDGCIYRWGDSDNDYTNTGNYWVGETSARDLVSEYVEPSTESAATNNKIPHKHADLIIAWAQGSEIEYLEEEDGEFYQVHGQPSWDVDTTYRVKPEKKVVTKRIFTSVDTGYTEGTKPNLELTFEDGKLIKAEVL